MPKDQRYKILIVEDDDINYLYLSIALEPENFEISRAATGTEAINKLVEKKENFDLILMDIKLPGIDGFETSKIIRQSLPEIPIIAQTAYYMPNEQKKFHDAKINDVVFKPFTTEEIIEIIKKYTPAPKGQKKNIGLLIL